MEDYTLTTAEGNGHLDSVALAHFYKNIGWVPIYFEHGEKGPHRQGWPGEKRPREIPRSRMRRDRRRLFACTCGRK